MTMVRLAGTVAAAIAALALAGCDKAKETGPEETGFEVVPVVATPVPAAVDNPASNPLTSFAGMDSDRDGFVSSSEHAKAAQAMYQMMDADKDGGVTVGEMDAALKAIGGSTARSSEKKIATIDNDGDGKLTIAEYVAGANGTFAAMDASKDERLDKAEWTKGHAMPTPAPTGTKAAG